MLAGVPRLAPRDHPPAPRNFVLSSLRQRPTERKLWPDASTLQTRMDLAHALRKQHSQAKGGAWCIAARASPELTACVLGGGGKGADGPCARRPTNTIGLPESAFAGPYSHGWGHDLRELRCPAGIATIHLVNRGWPRAERQYVRASSSCGAKLRASHRLRHASAL